MEQTTRQTKYCPYCGSLINAEAQTCMYCGEWVVSRPQAQPVQQFVQQPVRRKSNGIGTAGFVLALVGLVLCWLPIVDVILWFLAFIFTIIGMFKRPRGLSIAGFIISLIDLTAMILLIDVILDFLDFL